MVQRRSGRLAEGSTLQLRAMEHKLLITLPGDKFHLLDIEEERSILMAIQLWETQKGKESNQRSKKSPS